MNLDSGAADQWASRRKQQQDPEAIMNWILDIGKELLRAVSDPYRPELHYMRGPGPKWRAKHPAS
jgi:hypothetical protein